MSASDANAVADGIAAVDVGVDVAAGLIEEIGIFASVLRTKTKGSYWPDTSVLKLSSE